MKAKNLLLLCALLTVFSQANAQSCKDLFRDANQLVKEGKLEKAKTKYQQVVNCGNDFYVPDSKERIKWIDRVLHKPNKAKPFALSENEIIIPYQGGQDVITVDGEGSWTASVGNSGIGWCKIKRDKGKVYVISDANENSVERTCEISISMGGKTKKVKVKNDKAPEMLIPAVENVTFPSKGETSTVNILSNTDWKITDAPGWVITNEEDGKLTLTAKANDDNKERKAVIKIESTSKAVIINIYQGAGLDQLAFSKNNLHFGAEGGDEYINVYTDADDWALNGQSPWCHVEKVADNLLKIHCTPNDPINLSREGSVVVTTGKQTLGINISQEAKPFVAIIPNFGIGGRAISFGVSAGFVNPIISTSSGGNFTGSVVNYALGNNSEEASYSVSGGFNIGAFADIRLYKNFYLKAGLEYTHYSYKNTFQKDVERKILQTNQYYLGGTTQNNYEEEYTFNQLDIPILASYRIPTSNISHVQINAGPVIYYGLSAKMKLSGNTDTESLKAYKYINQQFTNQPFNDATYNSHYAGHGEMDLYSNHVDYYETYTMGNNGNVTKSQDLDDAPFKRLNFGIRIGAAYEYAGISIGVEYNLMLTNMANKKFWDGDRWTIFNQTPNLVMSGYKQKNNYLGIRLAYTFRY